MPVKGLAAAAETRCELPHNNAMAIMSAAGAGGVAKYILDYPASQTTRRFVYSSLAQILTSKRDAKLKTLNNAGEGAEGRARKHSRLPGGADY